MGPPVTAVPVDDVEPILGSTMPRIWTRPLVTGPPGPCGCGCSLDETTTYGLDVEWFAEHVMKVPLDPWQRWLAIHAGELLPDGRPRFRTILAIVARQQGKAVDTETPMLTTEGWSTMGELRAGDEVFHPDGHPTRIVAAHDVQCGRPCYRITTTDGRALVVDGEHLWTVQDRRKVTRKGRRGERRVSTYPWETLTTEEILARGLALSVRTNASGGTSTDYAFRLPRQGAITSKPADLPIDPYLLGAWLGDGDSGSPTLTVGDGDFDEMRALIESTGARIVSATRRERAGTAWRLRVSMDDRRRKICTLRATLTELGILGAKRVPDLYLTGSAEQRLALLQGLMDTDGSIYPTGVGSVRAEFCSTNRALADAVLYLARSLGWRATSKESAAKLNGVEVSRRWRVTWTPQQGEPIPFRLARKAARVQAPNARGGERNAVSIASIEPVESRPVRCITVDREDGLFLAGRDLVATHNSHLMRAFILFWQFVERRKMTLATSTDRSYAKAAWQGTVEFAKDCPDLTEDLDLKKCTTLQIGEEEFRTVHGAKYRFAAVNRRAGRSLTIDRLVLDEIREHHDFECWGAATNAQNAVRDAQTLAVTNQGDDKSVVLDWLRDAALLFIKTGEGDHRTGLFEWSAPDGSDPADPRALAMANPNFGRRTDPEALVGAAKAAKAGDSEALTSFRTEVLCIRVAKLDPAINPEAWLAAGTLADPDFSPYRGRVAFCADVSLDGLHASVVAAARVEDEVSEEARVVVGVVAAWAGKDCTLRLRRELPKLVEAIKPRVVGWFPNGPAAAVAADLVETKRRPDGTRWPPRGTKLEEIRGDVTAVCMGLAEQVTAGQIAHPGDEMLDAHIGAAQKQTRGDAWVFGRKDSGGPIDGAYAIAGAVHLARTLPPAPPPLAAL